MRISCIIPFYNPGRYFRPAIDSVLGQSRAPDEVILVDDGSTDGSTEVALSYGGQVILIREGHGGVGAARNRGLRAAAGDAIAFQDADDLWPDGRLMFLAAALEAEPGADGVVGRTVLRAEREPTREELAKWNDVHVPVLLQSMLLRRSLFDRVGLLSETLETTDDIEFIMRARSGGAVILPVDVTSLIYRRHDGNISREIGRSQSGTIDALRLLSEARRSRQ
jgi:glycosyltransferase involved in cell wall biosynthesis